MQTFTFPSSPDKFQPNPHPYAIRTTSTALLSRSNSSPKHSNHANHYVPSSPSPSPTRQKSISSHPNGHGHRYSRSMSSDSPRPLPVPPSSNANNDLPLNLKSWSPIQLASYLSTALNAQSTEVPVTEITAFVRDNSITGRAFLRLNESDLELNGIPNSLQDALLTTSRNLRQNVLKGRIWGVGKSLEDSPHSPTKEDDDNTPRHLRRRSNSHSYSSNPFVNGTVFYASDSSSSSMEDLSQTSPTGRYRNGRVEGMVKSFERSASFDDDPHVVRERSGSTHSSGSSGLEDEDHATRSTFRTARKLPTPPSFIPEEELTMEELLAKQSAHNFAPIPVQKKRRGVHAWEADDAGGVTVKRVIDGSNGRSTDHQLNGPTRTVDEIFSPDKIDVSVSVDREDEEEAKLKVEVESTKALLEAFRQRLVSVEEKIADMEEKRRQRELEQQKVAPPTGKEESIYNKVLRRMLSDAPEGTDKQVSPYDRFFNPKTISALPSYLVLVSLGVCAVVFKVVLRRTLGATVGRRK